MTVGRNLRRRTVRTIWVMLFLCLLHHMLASPIPALAAAEGKSMGGDRIVSRGELILDGNVPTLDFGQISPLTSPAIWTRAIHLEVLGSGQPWTLYVQSRGDFAVPGRSQTMPVSRLKWARAVEGVPPNWSPVTTSAQEVARGSSTGSPNRTEVWLDLRLDAAWDDPVPAPGEKYRGELLFTVSAGELKSNFVFPNPFSPALDHYVTIRYFHTGSVPNPTYAKFTIRNSEGRLVFQRGETVYNDTWQDFVWPGQNMVGKPVPDGTYSFSVSDQNNLIHAAGTIILQNSAPTGGTSKIRGRVSDSISGDGLPGVIMKLYTSSHKEVAATRTQMDGTFIFGSIPQGQYYIEATLPGYVPYTSPLISLGAGEDKQFNITLSSNSALFLTAEVHPQDVTPGDMITCKGIVENVGTRPLKEVVLEDLSGWPFEPLTHLEEHPTLIQRIDWLEVGEKKAVEFKMTVHPNAEPGIYFCHLTVKAAAVKPGGHGLEMIEQSARAKVKIRPGVFDRSGIVMGRAFLDFDGDGTFDDGESPAVGMSITTQLGHRVKTGSTGEFTIKGLTPGMYAIRPVPCNDLQAFDAIVVDVPQSGGIVMAEIPIRKTGQEPDQVNTLIHGRNGELNLDILAAGDLMIGAALDAPGGPSPSPLKGRLSGTLTIKGSAPDWLRSEYDLRLTLDSRGLIPAGAQDDADTNLIGSPLDLFDEDSYSLRYADPMYWALNVKANANTDQGDLIFKAGHITLDQATRNGAHDPSSAWLPSQGTTPSPSCARLPASIDGIGMEFRSKEAQGNMSARFGSFLGTPRTVNITDRLPGTGGPGPYRLRNIPITVGSEKIHVEARDPNSMSLAYTLSPRYTIDYATGSVTFDRSIGKMDSAGNLMIIVASYESMVERGNPAFMIGGAKFELSRENPGDSTGFSAGLGLSLPLSQCYLADTTFDMPSIFDASVKFKPFGNLSLNGEFTRSLDRLWSVGLLANPSKALEIRLKSGIQEIPTPTPDSVASPWALDHIENCRETREYQECEILYKLDEQRSISLSYRGEQDADTSGGLHLLSAACDSGSSRIGFEMGRTDEGAETYAFTSKQDISRFPLTLKGKLRKGPGRKDTSGDTEYATPRYTTSLEIGTAVGAGRYLRFEPHLDLAWHSPGSEDELASSLILGVETTDEAPFHMNGTYQRDLAGGNRSSLSLGFETLRTGDVNIEGRLQLSDGGNGIHQGMKLAFDYRPSSDPGLVSIGYVSFSNSSIKTTNDVSENALMEGSLLLAKKITQDLSTSIRFSRKIVGEYRSSGMQAKVSSNLLTGRALFKINPRFHLMSDYSIATQEETGVNSPGYRLEAIFPLANGFQLSVGWASMAAGKAAGDGRHHGHTSYPHTGSITGWSSGGPYIRLGFVFNKDWFIHHTGP